MSGRELDMAVEREVFGREVIYNYTMGGDKEPYIRLEGRPGRLGAFRNEDGSFEHAVWFDDLPRYSADIAPAMLVWRRMEGLGLTRAMASWFVDEVCTGISGSSDYEPGLDELQIVLGRPDLPELICRAALQGARRVAP